MRIIHVIRIHTRYTHTRETCVENKIVLLNVDWCVCICICMCMWGGRGLCVCVCWREGYPVWRRKRNRLLDFERVAGLLIWGLGCRIECVGFSLGSRIESVGFSLGSRIESVGFSSGCRIETVGFRQRRGLLINPYMHVIEQDGKRSVRIVF